MKPFGLVLDHYTCLLFEPITIYKDRDCVRARLRDPSDVGTGGTPKAAALDLAKRLRETAERIEAAAETNKSLRIEKP